VSQTGRRPRMASENAQTCRRAFRRGAAHLEEILALKRHRAPLGRPSQQAPAAKGRARVDGLRDEAGTSHRTSLGRAPRAADVWHPPRHRNAALQLTLVSTMNRCKGYLNACLVGKSLVCDTSPAHTDTSGGTPAASGIICGSGLARGAVSVRNAPTRVLGRRSAKPLSRRSTRSAPRNGPPRTSGSPAEPQPYDAQRYPPHR